MAGQVPITMLPDDAKALVLIRHRYTWGFYKKSGQPDPTDHRFRYIYGTVDTSPLMQPRSSRHGPPSPGFTDNTMTPHHHPHQPIQQRELTLVQHLSQLYPIWGEVIGCYSRTLTKDPIPTCCFWRLFHEACVVLGRYRCRYEDLTQFDMGWWTRRLREQPSVAPAVLRGHVELPCCELIQNLSLIHI